jgi:hypothetical protein
VHLFLMNNWIRDLLSSKAADIYRMKGVMAISGAKAKCVYQVCVHPLVRHAFSYGSTHIPSNIDALTLNPSLAHTHTHP